MSLQSDVHPTNSAEKCDVTCSYCHETVERNYDQQSVRCSCCSGIYHQHCTGLSVEVFTVLMSIIVDAGWVCRNCCDISALQQLVNKNCEEISDMRVSIACLYEELHRARSGIHVNEQSERGVQSPPLHPEIDRVDRSSRSFDVGVELSRKSWRKSN